jgi:hypothetical protein
VVSTTVKRDVKEPAGLGEKEFHPQARSLMPEGLNDLMSPNPAKVLPKPFRSITSLPHPRLAEREILGKIP